MEELKKSLFFEAKNGFANLEGIYAVLSIVSNGYPPL